MDVGAPSCSDTDTSDDEDLLPYSSTLGSSDVQIFSERRQRLQRSITKLRQRRTSYLALVGIHEQGNATCSEELHGLFDRVDRNRLALQTRVDALETERRQNVGFKEQLEHIEVRFHCKLREVEEQKAETDQRIQDLMDRLVTLLSAPFIDAVTQDRIVQEFTDALSSLDLKFSRAKVQLDQALDENRAIALRVTDAQRFTTRLDEELCHRQGYLFEAARKRPTRNRLTFREGQIPGESPRVKLGDSSQVSSQKDGVSSKSAPSTSPGLQEQLSNRLPSRQQSSPSVIMPSPVLPDEKRSSKEECPEKVDDHLVRQKQSPRPGAARPVLHGEIKAITSSMKECDNKLNDGLVRLNRAVVSEDNIVSPLSVAGSTSAKNSAESFTATQGMECSGVNSSDGSTTASERMSCCGDREEAGKQAVIDALCSAICPGHQPPLESPRLVQSAGLKQRAASSDRLLVPCRDQQLASPFVSQASPQHNWSSMKMPPRQPMPSGSTVRAGAQVSRSSVPCIGQLSSLRTNVSPTLRNRASEGSLIPATAIRSASSASSPPTSPQANTRRVGNTVTVTNPYESPRRVHRSTPQCAPGSVTTMDSPRRVLQVDNQSRLNNSCAVATMSSPRCTVQAPPPVQFDGRLRSAPPKVQVTPGSHGSWTAPPQGCIQSGGGSCTLPPAPCHSALATNRGSYSHPRASSAHAFPRSSQGEGPSSSPADCRGLSPLPYNRVIAAPCQHFSPRRHDDGILQVRHT